MYGNDGVNGPDLVVVGVGGLVRIGRRKELRVALEERFGGNYTAGTACSERHCC